MWKLFVKYPSLKCQANAALFCNQTEKSSGRCPHGRLLVVIWTICVVKTVTFYNPLFRENFEEKKSLEVLGICKII